MNIGFRFSPSITFLAMAVALLHPAVPCEAQTVVTNTLYPVADSYVRDGSSSNSNFGTITSLYARTNFTIINNGYVMASYLKFNLSSVSGLSSAKLRIYAKLNASQGPIAVAAYSATDTNWTETGITWSNRPALGTQLGSVEVINNTEQWYEYDVTSFIKGEKAAGRTFVSLALYATSVSINNTANWTVVRSREAASNIPELVCLFDPSMGDWGPVMTWGYPDAEGSGRNVAVHLVVLPTGKLIMYPYNTPPRLWDPVTSTFTTLPWPVDQGDRHNIFCGAHSHIPDGRVLFTGGDNDNNVVSLVGESQASYFNPFDETWTILDAMGTLPNSPAVDGRRWYGTSTALANGDVLVASGFTDREVLNPLPEVWTPVGAGGWTRLVTAQNLKPPPYTRTFLAPNGKVFFATGCTTGDHGTNASSPYSHYLDTSGTSGTGAWSSNMPSGFVPKLPGHNNPWNPVAAACMDEAGTVYWFGGGYEADGAPAQPTNACEKINLAAATPQWTLIAPMTNAQGVPQPRKFHTATILPDGTFLITSGSDTNVGADQFSVGKHALLYNPAADTWTTLAKEAKFRGYHSTAVLLPDGRVLSASGYGEWLDPSFPADANAEIFSPPYLFKGTRPVISCAPSVVGYGATFFVGTPDATNIMKVTWTRLGNTTHGFNWDQRINTLTNFSQTSGGLNIPAPANPTNCPPGYYMLWLINSNGVPSESKMVRISPDSVTPTVTVTATDAYAAEPEYGSDNGAFTVTRSGGNNSSALTVYYAVSGTATPTNDYTALSNSVTIPAYTNSAQISVNVVDDSLYEWNETVIITLSTSTNQAYVIGGCSSAEVTIYSFLDLGVLPGGTESFAFSVNPSNGIAGGSAVNGNSRAFRSIAGQALTGADDLHPGLAQYFGLPASNSVSVVWDQTTNRFAGEFTYTNATRAWVSDSCSPGYQQLVAPGSSQNFIRAVSDWAGNTEGAGYSLINGINRVCHWYIYDCQPQYTYAYNIGGVVGGGYHSYGLGIKWSKVVGFVAYPAGNKGFIWDWNFSGSGPTYLNPPTGGTHTEAYDIDKYSSSTNIVGYATTNGLKTACYWTYNGYSYYGISPTLLTKPAGWSNSIAQALNDQSKIVGNYYQPSAPTETDRRACLWESGSLVVLNNIVPVGSSWILLTAEDINSQNHVVGLAWNGTQIRGFRLKP